MPRLSNDHQMHLLGQVRQGLQQGLQSLFTCIVTDPQEPGFLPIQAQTLARMALDRLRIHGAQTVGTEPCAGFIDPRTHGAQVLRIQ